MVECCFLERKEIISMKLYTRMRGGNNQLVDLINDLPNGIVMAEIGCYAGESSILFLQSGKIKHFYAVDPWSADRNGEWWNNAINMNLSPKMMKRTLEVFDEMEWAEECFDFRIKPYENVTKLKMIFEEALPVLPELDFVYIDGDHSYNAVKKDISNARKIIKATGVIAGHDYDENDRVMNENVVKAVDEFFDKKKLKFYKDSSWLIHASDF